MYAKVDKLVSVVGWLMVRWLECLGENPPLSRDHGIHAWRYLHPQRRPGQTPRRSGLAITPPLYLVPSEGPTPRQEPDPILVRLAEEADFPHGEILKSGRCSPRASL